MKNATEFIGHRIHSGILISLILVCRSALLVVCVMFTLSSNKYKTYHNQIRYDASVQHVDGARTFSDASPNIHELLDKLCNNDVFKIIPLHIYQTM